MKRDGFKLILQIWGSPKSCDMGSIGKIPGDINGLLKIWQFTDPKEKIKALKHFHFSHKYACDPLEYLRNINEHPEFAISPASVISNLGRSEFKKRERGKERSTQEYK